MADQAKQPLPSAASLRWRALLRALLLGLGVVIINVLVYLLLPPAWIEKLGAFGYLGAFVTAAFANATVLVPVPYYPLLIRLGQALNPWGVVLAGAAGSVLGELVAYAVGRSGRQAVEESTFYRWVHRQMGHPWRVPLVLFAISAPPNPFFDVAGLIAGALGVPLWIYVGSTFAGRLVRMATVIWLGLIANGA